TARPDYTATYYDGIGRGVATAQYGNQDDDSEPLDRPEATPVAADSTEEVLVSQTVYNAKGEVEEQIIPLEEGTPVTVQRTRTEYDAAGRVKMTTKNYDSSPTE